MANNLQFTTPNGENLTFTITAQADGSNVLYSQSFTTAASEIFLKVYATGDAAKTSLDPANLVQGTMYEVEAFSDAGFTTPVDITTWGGTNITYVGYTFAVDRRPIAAFGFGNSSTSALIPPTQVNSVGMHWGVNDYRYRRTPLAGAAMSDPNTNGRLKYANDLAGVVAPRGFERMHYWNIAGFTNYQDNQPYYNSNPYTGLGFTEAKYIQTANTIGDAVLSPSPFTPNGVDGTPGDSEAAWAYAVQATKDLVTAEGNTPEVGVYFGYRPFYDANDMANNDRTFLGHDPDWTGTPGSPGFLASTGFDYVDDNTPGYSASDEAYNKWFAPELAGLYSMGFETVGLDVGAKIFLNTKGMITGGSGNNNSNPPFTTGDDRLIDLFNSYGMKPYGEAIPMETYGLNGDPLTGANAEAYTDIAYMGFWKNSVGYSGLDENGGALVISANTTIHNPTAGDGTATVGPNANTWDPNTTEIHCVFRWNNSGDINQLIGKDGAGNSLGYGWLTMKQVLYDLHTAGMIISISGSVESPMTDGLGYVITAAEFHQYVMDLSTGAITARPAGSTNWDTNQIGAGVADGYGSTAYATTFDPSYPAGTTVDGELKYGSLGYANSPGVSKFASSADRGNMAAYVAVYVQAAEAADGTFGNAATAGWYVFGPAVDDNPGVSGTNSYAALAWPTGGSDGAGSGGLFNNGARHQVGVANLSAYTDATGEGGTDSWTPYPF
jgi:hypothetical protein